jgi:hypothetical protein
VNILGVTVELITALSLDGSTFIAIESKSLRLLPEGLAAFKRSGVLGIVHVRLDSIVAVVSL